MSHFLSCTFNEDSTAKICGYFYRNFIKTLIKLSVLNYVNVIDMYDAISQGPIDNQALV